MTDRQSTHGPGCWSWGPRHYECALREIEALRAEVERLKSMTAVTMGVGSGDGNLFVHGDCESIKAAQAIVLERGALRAERDALRDALSEALTRIAAIGYPVSPDGEYSEDGEWTFSDAVPRAVDAEEVKAAFLVIRAALRERLGVMV